MVVCSTEVNHIPACCSLSKHTFTLLCGTACILNISLQRLAFTIASRNRLNILVFLYSLIVLICHHSLEKERSRVQVKCLCLKNDRPLTFVLCWGKTPESKVEVVSSDIDVDGRACCCNTEVNSITAWCALSKHTFTLLCSTEQITQHFPCYISCWSLVVT